MDEPRPPRRREAWMLLGLAASSWMLTLGVYGGMDVSRDDVAWLAPLREFLAGYESRKDYAHASWGLLHWMGHHFAPEAAWSEGRVGPALSAIATLSVPWCGFVAWRVARSVAPEAAPLATALITLSPAVAWGASTPNFLIRGLAAGLGMLGAVRAWDGVRAPRRSDLFVTLVLTGVGLLFHPWAVTGPLVLAPLVFAEGVRVRRVGRSLVLVLTPLAASAIAFVVLSQGQRITSAGAPDWAALLLVPVVPWVMMGWQVPALGWLGAQLPMGFCAVIGLALPLFLFLRVRAVPAFWLLLGATLSAVPELAAEGLPQIMAAMLSGNHAKAAFCALIAGSVGLACLLRGSPRALVAILLLLALPRFVFIEMETVRITEADSSAARRIAAELLVPAAAYPSVPYARGDASKWMEAEMNAKWLPDVPPGRRAIGRHPAKSDAEPLLGLDFGLLTSASQRCALWFEPNGGDRFNTAKLCKRRPIDSTWERGGLCELNLSAQEVPGTCTAPPHASSTVTIDPQSGPLSLLAVLALVFGIGLSLGRPGRPNDPSNPGQFGRAR